MQASVMLSAALPTSIEGNTVILTFSNRANFEMMQLPKKQEFIRKLLARCLDIEDGSVPVRLHLDERVAPAQQRRIQRAKVRHDPLAALEALKEASPSSDTGPSAPPSRWIPQPAPHFDAPESEDDTPAAHPNPVSTTPTQLSEHKSNSLDSALDDPLVQEILMTFGGRILD